MEGIRWSDEYISQLEHKEKIDALYKKAIEMIKGGKLYGVPINLNNSKEVIATLFILAQDYNLFHEKF